MSNHYHLVLRPLIDGEMSRFMGWVGGTHTMRYHAHYHTSGLGHLYQQRYKSFPIQDDDHFFVVCRYEERNALRAGLVKKAENWRWGSLWRWLQRPEPDPKLLSMWPQAHGLASKQSPWTLTSQLTGDAGRLRSYIMNNVFFTPLKREKIIDSPGCPSSLVG